MRKSMVPLALMLALGLMIPAGASAKEDTPDPKQAYAPFERAQRGRPEYWDRLPWS